MGTQEGFMEEWMFVWVCAGDRELDMSISPSVTLPRARRWLVVGFGYCAGQAKVRIWRADGVRLACVQLEWGHMTGSVAGN